MKKNMIDNGIKIGSSKYNPIIVTFSNGRKSFHLSDLIRKPILQLWTAYQGMSEQTGLTVSEKTLT